MSRNALVVGINTYQYFPALQAPARDAEAIASQLQASGEFRVQRQPEVIQSGQPQVGVKTKVGLRELEAALVNLFKPKGNNIPQTALFYFSGHGIQKEAGIQEGYLALSDSNPESGFYGLSLFWLRRLLQESPVRQRIIWLDCCHSGELLNFLEADPGARPGTDRLFMAASREYESAYESLDSPYSVFTQALLKGLDPAQSESGIVTNHNLTACVSQQLKEELQQPLFESSGSEIVLTRSTHSSAPAKASFSSDVCPYRGLEFFDETHSEYFFGRADLTDQLIDKLRVGRFVAVVGASGSGKSSLVRAGLMHELRQGQRFSGSSNWQIKLITPTADPLKSLAGAFVDLEASNLDRAEQLRRSEAFLRSGSMGLGQLVRASLMSEPIAEQPHQRPHMLLVIDQFEEVFTLCHGALAEEQRHYFFNCLTGALQAAGNSLSILIVLRADFFGKCSLYESLAQQIESNLVMVTPLSYEQIKSTITRPALKVGLTCEPNLVYTMLLDVIGAPGELPLLQYTLTELWQQRQIDSDGTARLTLDTYTALGGVRGTLQKRATEIFYSLTLEEQAIAKRIFLALTQLGEGTEDTRRRVLKSELVNPSFSVESVEQTLEKLVAAKLVVTSQVGEAMDYTYTMQSADQPTMLQGGNSTQATSSVAQAGWMKNQEAIDVTHEALIRNWSLLRNWLDESREMLRRQRRIERAAQEWDWAGQIVAPEYLLSGTRLSEVEDFLGDYANELSALAHRYIAASQHESHRVRRASRRLQLALPSVLLIVLIGASNQYRNLSQLGVRERLPHPETVGQFSLRNALQALKVLPSDPMSSLALNRLATADEQAQAGSTQTCQHLRFKLKGKEGEIHELIISPNQRYTLQAETNGTIHMRSLDSDPSATSSCTTEATEQAID